MRYDSAIDAGRRNSGRRGAVRGGSGRHSCSGLSRAVRAGAMTAGAICAGAGRAGLALAALLAALSASQMALSDQGQMRTGRYEITKIAPTQAQLDPLVTKIQMNVAPEITTVGQAVESLLWGTGYRLHKRHSDLKLLMQRPLAASQRVLGPISIRSALQMLAGREWDLVEDPLHRLVTFELLQPWRQLTTNPRREMSADASPAGEGPAAAGGHRRQLTRMYRVRPGSLRANITRLTQVWGWTLVGWEATLGNGNTAPDWQVHSHWMLSADSLAEALERLLVPHRLRAVLHRPDGTVSVHLARL